MLTSALRRRTVVAVGSALALVATTAATAAPSTAAVTGGISRLNLVADVAGAARATDPNLVNPWGLSASPTGPLWVSNAGTATSTVYSGATAAGQGANIVPLVVAIPGGVPTGQVFNTSNGFALANGSKALFVFASATGAISAWNGGTTAELVVPSTGGSYTGLALVTTSTASTLLAADFHNAHVDIFDSSFHKLSKPAAFQPTGIPAGYAPFNVAALSNRVYVSYAKQNATRSEDVPGLGHGYVNVFTKTGAFVKTLVAQGDLNSPWGMAIAPTGFGSLAGTLLVGNFGNGRIHAYSSTGTLVDTLRTSAGKTIVIPGLWGLLPGNGAAGRTSDVWFSAGPGGETHGLLGILRPSA